MIAFDVKIERYKYNSIRDQRKMTANILCNIKNFMALPLVLVHFHFYGIFVCVDCLHENIHRTREFHGYIEMHEAFSLRSCVCVSVWKCRWNVNDNKYFECEQIP